MTEYQIPAADRKPPTHDKGSGSGGTLSYRYTASRAYYEVLVMNKLIIICVRNLYFSIILVKNRSVFAFNALV